MTVEVVDVSPDGLAGSPLLDLELRAPTRGQVTSGYLFQLEGTVVIRPASPSIRFFSAAGAGCISRGRAYVDESQHAKGVECGFSFVLGCAAQPRDFAVGLAAHFEDGSETRLARISGRRSRLESDYEPSVQPLLVTTLGRSGSSIFIEALERHPEVAAYHPLAADPRPSTYWMSVFRELSDPASSVRQLAHSQSPNYGEPGWWLGKDALQESFVDDPVVDWLGIDHVRSLAGYCQSRVDALYTKIAAEAGVTASYFAEKAGPYVITSTLRELYPRSREVILVRDWRDVFCSMRAYSAKRGVQLFGRELSRDDEQHLRFLRQGIDGLMEHWEAVRDDSHMVRYEDLVLDPAATMGAVLDYLELDRSSDIVATMCELVHDSGPDGEAHRTTASPRQSIGRWRRDLSGRLRERSLEELGPALTRLGYDRQ